jgi:hypothetical protein
LVTQAPCPLLVCSDVLEMHPVGVDPAPFYRGSLSSIWEIGPALLLKMGSKCAILYIICRIPCSLASGSQAAFGWRLIRRAVGRKVVFQLDLIMKLGVLRNRVEREG